MSDRKEKIAAHVQFRDIVMEDCPDAKSIWFKVDQQSFCIGEAEDKQGAEWYREQFTIAMMRFLSNLPSGMTLTRECPECGGTRQQPSNKDVNAPGTIDFCTACTDGKQSRAMTWAEVMKWMGQAGISTDGLSGFYRLPRTFKAHDGEWNVSQKP